MRSSKYWMRNGEKNHGKGMTKIMEIETLNDDELLDVTRALDDDNERELVCERCCGLFSVNMECSRNRRYCDACLSDMLEEQKEKRSRNWKLPDVNSLELLDFAYRVEKKLCHTGAELECEWDKALEAVKFNDTPENREKVRTAMRFYFRHRRNCSQCTTNLIEIME